MSVKIDIPGIGEVEAENAASEDTLLAILAALDNTSNTAKARAKDEKDASKAQHDNTKQVKEGTRASKELNVGWKAAAEGLAKAVKTVSLTAISMATKFATSFEEIAEQPIKSTADSLNQMIDATTSVTTGLVSAIPIIGKLVSAFIEVGAELAKAANNTFAQQLQKNVDALQQYAKVGISFAGGMTEMQARAQEAGMGILQFAKVVASSRDELNKLGLAGGDAVLRMSNAMGISANESKKMTKSGESFRTEMFKMGYAYEEQAELFAGFMANQQAAGKLRAMSDREIAIGTREYATNLKVISDITGQDAKRLMDQSREQALRGSLMASLDADAKEAFIKANSMLAKAGPDAQKALLQALTFNGKVIDPKLAVQPELVKMAQDVANQVKAGNKDILNTTTQSMSVLQHELTTSGKNFGQAVDRGLVAEVGGMAVDVATSRNQLMTNLGSMFDPDQAKKSKDNAESMATAQDDLAKQTAYLYNETNEFARLMEGKVNKELARYADLLADVNDMTMGVFRKFIDNDNKTKTPGMSLTELGKQMLKDLNPFGDSAFKIKKPPKGQEIARMKDESDEEYRKRMLKLQNPIPMFAEGGSIPAGKVGMAGEKGPEIIAGPAEVLSTKSTEKLMKSVDMLAAVQEGATSSQPNAMTSAKIDEVIRQLTELVRLMRDNVNHTAKVVQNTN